jgi:hypothetical protein
MKTVKAWAIYNSGGHLLEWTVRGARREAIEAVITTLDTSETWRHEKRRDGLSCRRVFVMEATAPALPGKRGRGKKHHAEDWGHSYSET